ncbi:DeoR/GlpR family DNA-binding transcription regulator [Paenibacillus montanisoli]|uniref:DeoR/GlpR family DNA-binding transcription regulator n=1 Tax=Paenibacillus montanisoli TaxID=2081970 RepID=UPI001403ED87|nr:DeoR/GlpR family DNA-binding transcription regulator [Paenibacillus montanisoli]
MTFEEKIYVEERRNRILEIIQKKNRVSVAELSKEFNLGEITIRRDLSELEERGLIRRTHGGAIPIDNGLDEPPLKEREMRNRSQKERIAQFVAQLIRNGESIMIDGGSTTLQIAKHLRMKKDLTIVTNSMSLADEFMNFNECNVIVCGGELRRSTGMMIGSITERTLRLFRADRVIIGMSSMMPEEGLFTVNAGEAECKRIMMECGKEIIVVMDSSKINKVSFSFVSDFSKVDKFITDDGISDDIVTKLDQAGVEVIVV